MDRNSLLLVKFCSHVRILGAIVSVAVFFGATAHAQQSWVRAAGSSSVSPATPAVMVSDESPDDVTQTLVYKFPKPLITRAASGIASVSIAGLDEIGDIGTPALPYLPVRIVVPQGAAVESVEILPSDPITIADGVTLRHVTRPVALSQTGPTAATARDEAIYSSRTAYPASPEKHLAVRRKLGVNFQELALTPVIYEPLDGRVSYYKEIKVVVKTGARVRPPTRSATAVAATVPLTASGVVELRSTYDRARVAALVDNVSLLDAYSRAAPVSLQASAPSGAGVDYGAIAYSAPTLPCRPDAQFVEGFEHVIVTTAELMPAFVELVTYRRKAGISSTLVTVESIAAVYPGVDTQEMIRNFIRDAQQVWGTDYIVLGGDTGQVPARMLWVESVPGGDIDTMPSDLYYQCLDGSFNSNGNTFWGEPDDGQDFAGGDVDLYAEVAIGRVPAETVGEVRSWITKLRAYDAARAAGLAYTESALMVGERLGFGGISEFATEMMEQIRLGSSADGYRTVGFAASDLYRNVDRLYDTPAETWDKSKIAFAINSGKYAVINHLGHSDTDYNMRMRNADADALSNRNPIFLYSQGCIAGAFDRDCIAEHFITSSIYGFFGGVLNARYGWGSTDSTDGPSQRFNRRFWDAVFGDCIPQLGLANQLSHERNAYGINEPCIRWCYYETNLFGDPIQAIDNGGASLALDREYYKSSATAAITLKMAVGMVNETSYDVDVRVFETDGVLLGEFAVTLTMSASDGHRAVFTGALPLSPLSLTHGQRIEVVFSDGMSLSDSAEIDDVAPQISSFDLTASDFDAVTAAWSCDEPVTAEVCVGRPPAPPSGQVMNSDTFSSSGSFVFSGLESNASYLGSLIVEDRAGNVATSPVNPASTHVGDYAAAILVEGETVAQFDMEEDVTGWVTESLPSNICWQLGTPSYGPHAASRCWGTVIDGRYEDNTSASLISPPVTIGANPVIAFRHWYDIENTPIGLRTIADADCGRVEVFCDGVWHDVGQYAKTGLADGFVQGKSQGWEAVRIALPADFAHKTIRLRFRFISDSYHADAANPAGWYIDAVSFIEAPENGLSVRIASVDDTTGGNGNLVAEPGETVLVSMESFNANLSVIRPASASLTLQTSGLTAGLVTMEGGTTIPLSYGVLASGMSVTSATPARLTISPNIKPGSQVTLLQVIEDVTGQRYENCVKLKIRKVAVISGVVREPGSPSSLPVAGATVVVSDSGSEFTTVTGADGTFAFTQVDEGFKYRVTASYGFASVYLYAVAPTESLLLMLPRPFIDVVPQSFDFSCQQAAPGTPPDLIPATLAIHNRDPEGDNTPSGSLDYAVSVNYLSPDSAHWLSFETSAPLTGLVTPGTSASLTLKVSNENMPPGEYSAEIVVDSNAANAQSVRIPVTLTVEKQRFLDFDGIKVDDSASVLQDFPGESSGLMPSPPQNDGDMIVEYAERVKLDVAIRNLNQYEAVRELFGVVSVESPLNGEVAVVDGYNSLSWPIVAPNERSFSSTPLVLDWALGSGQPYATLRFDGEDSDGPVSFLITVTNGTASTAYMNQVGGKVLKATRPPLTPTNVVSPVVGAIVSAESADGNIRSSEFTTTNGAYSVTGLRPGVAYWCSVAVKDSSPLIPPFGRLIESPLCAGDTNGVTLAEEFMCLTHGTNAPVIRLDGVVVDDASFGDGDEFIDPGEELNVTLRLRNFGTVSAQSLTASLSAVDIFERAKCMEVTSADQGDVTTEVLAGAIAELALPFKVRVDSGAQAGDYQRFQATVKTVGLGDEKIWNLEFRLEVNPRVSVSGIVTFADGATAPSLFEDVRLKLRRISDGFTVFATPLAQDTVGDDGQTVPRGTFSFKKLPCADYALSVERVPDGYELPEAARSLSVTDDILATSPLTAFEIKKAAGSVSVPSSPGFDPAQGLSVTIPEGVSATNSLVVSLAADAIPATRQFTVTMRFNRSEEEVLDSNELPSPYATISDWSKLDSTEFRDDELEILFEEGTTIPQREAYLASRGLVATYHFKRIPATIAQPKSGSLRALSPQAFAAPGLVRTIQPSPLFKLNSLPNDTLVQRQWALKNTRQTGGTAGADIGAQEAWETSKGSRDTVVAICDTGVLLAHPDLTDNLWINSGESGLDSEGNDRATNGIDDDGNGYVDDVHGWNVAYDNNFVGDLGSPANGGGHGTHVAGIIGAVGDNSRGVCGVNHKVSMMIMRLVDNEGNFASGADIARAIEYAVANGAKLSNHSWGGPNNAPVLYEMIKAAGEDGHLVCIAAGNSSEDIDKIATYPASYSTVLDNIIVVAATDHDDRIADFSSFGAKSVHLAAPGQDILSTYLDVGRNEVADDELASIGNASLDEGSYASLSGTSMATPYVSGAAALLWSIAPEASRQAIKKALLNGVSTDAGLAGFVKTSGRLDLARSIRLLGRDWMRFGQPQNAPAYLTRTFSLAAGQSEMCEILFNDPPHLPAGSYSGAIVVQDELGRQEIPVTLEITPRAFVEVVDVKVVDDDNRNGVANASENATLMISLKNGGSSDFVNLRVVLESADCVVAPASNSWNYGYITGLDTTGYGAFGVTFGEAGTAALMLKIYDGQTLVASLPIQLGVSDANTLTVTVKNSSGAPVPGATVELVGPGAGKTATDSQGVAIIADLPDGSNYRLRVISPSYARHTETLAITGDISKTVTLAHADISPSVTTLEMSAFEGMTATSILTVASGSGFARPTEVKVSKRVRIGIFDDRADLSFLKPQLEELGFEVDWYTNNFAVKQIFYPTHSAYRVLQYVRYTWDDSLLSKYDAVISSIVGGDGCGRIVAENEATAYSRYIASGGNVVIIGYNPLSKPDNTELAEALGLSADSCSRTTFAPGTAASTLVAYDAIGAPFADLFSGDAIANTAMTFDTPSLTNLLVVGDALLTVGDLGIPVAYRSPVNGSGGRSLLWTGNSMTDLLREGAYFDVLRSYLWETCSTYDSAAPAWLSVTPAQVNLGANASEPVTVVANADRSLPAGEYEATILFAAEKDGAETTPITVRLSVTTPAIRVHNRSGSVTDFGGRPLVGDGSASSMIFQLIYAGPNGIPDAPEADGSPGGDDVMLTASETGASFGYFGSGEDVTANLGKFDMVFNLPFSAGLENAKIYVRAWDGSTPLTALAWGDSQVVHTLAYSADEFDPGIDFGSWVVNKTLDSLHDSNGDTIPDGWNVEYLPGLDPREPVSALDFDLICTPTNQIVTSGSAPARLVVSEKFLFVLEKNLHRIAVYNRFAPHQLIGAYGANGGSGISGSGDGEFLFPQGMGADPRAGQYRFAVADTRNHRVQVFTYDPDTGAVIFERKFGTRTPFGQEGISADTSTFADPLAVDFVPDGSILVGDTGNNRILRFTTDGVFREKYLTAVGGDASTEISGLCFGTLNGISGYWIADSDDSKMRVAFFRFKSTSPQISIGTPADGTFDKPTDVQVWTVGTRQRLVVSDCNESRVRILDLDGTVLADLGRQQAVELQTYEQLALPFGVTPVDNTNQIYVADQGKNRVVWYGLVLDADGDGMEDIWEDMNGLDSTIDDASGDADGDGLSNVGEYRAGTNPANSDSDGDGVSDLTEMYNGTDPLDPDSTPDGITTLISLVAVPDKIEVSSATLLTATFASPPVGVVKLELLNEAGEVVASGAMTPVADGLTQTFDFVGVTEAVGFVDARIVSASIDPARALFDDILEVLSAEEDEVESISWPIRDISLNTAGEPALVLKWNLNEPGIYDARQIDAVFQLEHSPTLIPVNWFTNSPALRVTIPANSAETVTKEILFTEAIFENSSKLDDMPTGFFRLWLINKPVNP